MQNKDNDIDSKEIDRVKNSIQISFDDYILYFLGLKTKEDFRSFLVLLEKQKLHDFPDLYKIRLKESQHDSITTVEPLESSNSLYMNICKHVQLYKYKQKLYNTTVFENISEKIYLSALN